MQAVHTKLALRLEGGAEEARRLGFAPQRKGNDEFHGDDAGSPFFAKLHVAHAPLTRYRPGDGPGYALTGAGAPQRTGRPW